MGRTTESLHLLPVLARKPAVASYWLRTAHLAQAMLVILILLVPTIVLSKVDAKLEDIYPPTVKSKYFGIKKELHDDPLLDERKGQARMIIWLGSLGLVGYLLLRHVPKAIRLAGEKAMEEERKADGLMASEPSSSIILYRSAIRLATDETQEASLRQKIDSFDRMHSSSRPGAAMPSESDATVVLSDSNRAAVTKAQASPEDRYRIIGKLGSGAMGITYRAEDTVLEREVAIKELLPGLAGDEDFVSRFRHEAKVLAKLCHPGIVQVYDVVEHSGRIWIVMELVRGGELADLIKEKGKLQVGDTARIGAAMADAMAHAHTNGVLHRDFKPSNVMLTPGGAPKITDFGLARLVQSGHRTQEGAVLGSPYYMSPEQAEGRPADRRSDIYSLGVVLYQMLTGRVPFEGESVASVLAQQVNREPDAPGRTVSGIPGELDSLVLSMMSKDPDKRIQDMTTIAEMLRGLENA